MLTSITATVKIRAEAAAEFTSWKARYDLAIGKFPGYVGSNIIPGSKPDSNEWTIVVYFKSKDELSRWHTSPERAEVVASGLPLFEQDTFAETVSSEDGDGEPKQAHVTEVIFSKIKAGKEDVYREWAARMQAEQAKTPGYKGMLLQQPDEVGGVWTTIIRFDSTASLETWMNSPQRQEMLKESREFIEHEQLTRLATAFPGWVPVDPATGKSPANWKTSLLVLLGLFPIVMLEMKYFSPILATLGMHASLATFVGNVVSVFATSYITMPLFVRWFEWWLFPSNTAHSGNLKGFLLLAFLFAVEIAALWNLLPW